MRESTSPPHTPSPRATDQLQQHHTSPVVIIDEGERDAPATISKTEVVVVLVDPNTTAIAGDAANHSATVLPVPQNNAVPTDNGSSSNQMDLHFPVLNARKARVSRDSGPDRSQQPLSDVTNKGAGGGGALSPNQYTRANHHHHVSDSRNVSPCSQASPNEVSFGGAEDESGRGENNRLNVRENSPLEGRGSGYSGGGGGASGGGGKKNKNSAGSKGAKPRFKGSASSMDGSGNNSHNNNNGSAGSTSAAVFISRGKWHLEETFGAISLQRYKNILHNCRQFHGTTVYGSEWSGSGEILQGDAEQEYQGSGYAARY